MTESHAFWDFPKLNAGVPERKPHEAEFFTFGNSAEVIVREAIQNSLDARYKDCEQVVVRFTLGEIKKDDVRHFLGDVEKHLDACKELKLKLPVEYQHLTNVRVLTIEDFGTTGLDGETRRVRNLPGEKNNFYDFWWREGISSKTGKEAGRWGVGKISFYNVSELRSIWGITIRRDDNRELMLGKTMLEAHRIGNEMYDYYGYFKGGEGDEPVQNAEIIREFKEKFHIRRSDSEFGFSLVIPMPLDEITYERIIQAAIYNYFFAILKGRLKIEIKDTRKQKNTVIDANSLLEISESLEWEETPWNAHDVGEILRFVAETRTVQKSIILKQGKVSDIGESSFCGKLEEVRDAFMQGNMLRFEIPITLKTNEEVLKTGIQTKFDVFLKKYQELEAPDEFYIRSDILIPGIRSIGKHPVRAILVAEEESISEFLGDAETPAHIDWNERSEGFQEKYTGGTGNLRFIKRCMGKIVSLLDQLPHESKREFLIDFFFVEGLAEQKKDQVKPPTIPIVKKPHQFNIGKVAGGFKLTLEKGLRLPIIADLKVAYHTWRGNPFARYSPFDFDLTDSAVSKRIHGGKITKCGGNKIEISVLQNDFELEITGFDPKRDVIIDIRGKENEAKI